MLCPLCDVDHEPLGVAKCLRLRRVPQHWGYILKCTCGVLLYPHHWEQHVNECGGIVAHIMNTTVGREA